MNQRPAVLRLAPLIAAAVLFLPVVAAAFAQPAAAANPVTESRSLTRFDRIRLAGAFRTAIANGAPAQRFTVSGTPDAVANVTTTVDGGTLTVGMKPGFGRSTAPLTLSIAVPALRAVALEGAGSAAVTGVRDSIELQLSGAGSMSAAGRARAETIALDGTGQIDATGVDARDATAANNGVGSIRLRVAGSLTASINGLGDIIYSGNPASVQSQVNGLGRIRHH